MEPNVPLIIGIRDVMRALGARSRQTVYDRLRLDPTFPKPRRVGVKSTVWLRSEIEAWAKALPVVTFDGQGAANCRKVEDRQANTIGAAP